MRGRLAIGFRANVWNIGAEGQLMAGAIAGGGIALFLAGQRRARCVLPLMVVAGMAGGMAWAAIPALLRDRFNANEILVSLMLVYVAQLAARLAGARARGRTRWASTSRRSKMFSAAALLPMLVEGTRLNVGFVLALAGRRSLGWLFLSRSFVGFQLQVGGMAPPPPAMPASRRGERSGPALLAGGGAGRHGRHAARWPGRSASSRRTVSPGYGFAAIIVAFVGRLHPVGICFASLLMALLYIGGELAQSRLGLPSCGHRRVPGHAAVLPAGVRRPDRLPPALEKLAMDEPSAPPRSPPRSTPARRRSAALGLLINEKSGVVNLGAEGMMLVARWPVLPSR